MSKVLIICGPTATGKTALALLLAKMIDGELVSADSRQVYKGMDIGTGKDLPEEGKRKCETRTIRVDNHDMVFPVYEYEGVPLWMYDVVNPHEEFNVSLYIKSAKSVIGDICARKKTPIIVGGTGLYISSLLTPLDTLSVPSDQLLRQELEKKDLASVQKIMREEVKDVWDTLNESDRNNKRRLVRKIEIAQSEIPKEKNVQAVLENYDVNIVGLRCGFPYLYKSIDERIEKQYDAGIVEEIQSLLDKGYSWDLPAMSAMGYREWKEYFESGKHESVIPSCLERWKFDEHGYARRQMTWFNKMEGIHWFDITSSSYPDTCISSVKEWYTGTNSERKTHVIEN